VVLAGRAVTDAARRLRATLGFLQLEPQAPELRLLHAWADTWSGVGAIVAGLHRTGYDLHLSQYGDNTWRATFYVTGVAHSSLADRLGSLPYGGLFSRLAWEAVRHAERNL
jgi:hypothetical protein